MAGSMIKKEEKAETSITTLIVDQKLYRGRGVRGGGGGGGWVGGEREAGGAGGGGGGKGGENSSWVGVSIRAVAYEIVYLIKKKLKTKGGGGADLYGDGRENQLRTPLGGTGVRIMAL